MAKKMRFALQMKDGIEVKTLSELQEHFDMDRVMEYYSNGKLETWLDDRYYEETADQIRELNLQDPELSRKLCEIFHVKYVPDALTPEEMEVRNQRIELLREITDDDEILAKVDHVAFSQEELADLLDAGMDPIYLCGKEFQIPLSKRDKTYIGIESKLSFTEERLAQYRACNIQFVNLVDDTETDKIELDHTDTDLSDLDEDMTEEDCAIRKMKDLLERYMSGEYIIWVGHYLHSDISVTTMFYSRDDIHSKFTAVKMAEDRVRKVYQYAEGLFSKYEDDHVGTRAVERFIRHVKADVIEITNLLHNLDGDIRKKNSVIIQELEELLNLKNMENLATKIAEKELEDSYYRMLPYLYLYNKEIVYQEVEHDPPGLFGKKDYYFDASKPYFEMAEELDDHIEQYSRSISRCFKTDILKPILDLIQRIH